MNNKMKINLRIVAIMLISLDFSACSSVFTTPDGVIDTYCHCLDKEMSSHMSLSELVESIRICDREKNKAVQSAHFSAEDESYIDEEINKCKLSKTLEHGGESLKNSFGNTE